MRANPYSNPSGLPDYEARAAERRNIRGRMQQGVWIVVERYDWVRTKNEDDEKWRGRGTRRSYFVRLLRSLVSCSEIEIMRHRLLGIVIGSRATAVAIIFHYYCYRSAYSALSPAPALPFRLPSTPTDTVTTCGVLRRGIEITRVNLTFDLISECTFVITRGPDHPAVR